MRATILCSSVLLVAAACGDQTISPTSAAEGTVLAGTLNGSVTAFTGDGRSVRQRIPPAPFSARLGHGVARTRGAATGALGAPSFSAAVADASGEGAAKTIQKNQMDLQGRKHVLEFVNIGRRGVLFTHYIGGVRRAMIVNRWNRDGNVWVLHGAQITFFDNSGEGIVSRAELTADDVRRVGSRSAFNFTTGFLRRMGRALAPAPLAAQELVDENGNPVTPPQELPSTGGVTDPIPADVTQYFPPDDGIIYHPELEAQFYATANCESIKWRMFGYLVLGTAACGSLNGFACAGAALGYWSAYDSYRQNCL